MANVVNELKQSWLLIFLIITQKYYNNLYYKNIGTLGHANIGNKEHFWPPKLHTKISSGDMALNFLLFSCWKYCVCGWTCYALRWSMSQIANFKDGTPHAPTLLLCNKTAQSTPSTKLVFLRLTLKEPKTC